MFLIRETKTELNEPIVDIYEEFRDIKLMCKNLSTVCNAVEISSETLKAAVPNFFDSNTLYLPRHYPKAPKIFLVLY